MAAKVAGLGVTAMEVTVGAVAVTVSAAEPMMVPAVAVMDEDPEVTAVASPAEVIVATPVSEEAQATVEVTLPVVPSV